MKILNADDNSDNLYLIEALFRGHGHEVVSARNGEEALRFLTDGKFDAIISDLLMPVMDGFQLIQAVRANPAHSRIPIIVYTATYTDEKDKALALSLGADRFLLKPAEPDVLLSAVEETLRARSAGIPVPVAPPPESEEETVVLKQYNSRLIAKLEKKMMELEQTKKALEEDIKNRIRAEEERNRLEEQLRQSQKLEAIGTLAGGIAHDFNNIITGILCAAGIGIHDAHDAARVQTHFKDIISAGTRATDLVRQILAFSRQQRIERKPISLPEAAAEAVRFLRFTIPSTVELRTDFAPDMPDVLADATQIHQIITNLCTNAWHAIGSRPDGRIEIILRSVVVSAEEAMNQPELQPLRYVRLSIRDNGCGMSAATRKRIFDPFYTTKPPGAGTGLGLSVVHGIMHACDGAILIESQPGEGSSFQLYFPALETLAKPAPALRSQLEKGRGQRIFFIDDEPGLVSIGENLLKYLGYEPVCFGDPLLALAALRDRPADAVLVDYAMPKCDGLDFATRALAEHPRLPIVLVTGFNTLLDAEQTRARGFAGRLSKPYDPAALAETLGKLFAPDEPKRAG